MKPKSSDMVNLNHSAYNGHSVEEYIDGKIEDICVKELFDWLVDGDTLLFWEWEIQNTLEQVYKRYYNKEHFDKTIF